MIRSKISYPIEIKQNELKISPDIDNEIRALLVELNDKGYITRFSCSGHRVKGQGYISFDGVLSDRELGEALLIAQRYGLCNIVYSQPVWEYGITDIRFELRGNWAIDLLHQLASLVLSNH